jgi:membrane protease YdiL (CAAX protease family)
MARSVWVAMVGAAVLAWVAAAPLPWPARAFVVLVLVVLPVLGVGQAVALGGEVTALPRLAVYVSSALGLWGLAGGALLAAGWSGMVPARLGLVMPGVGAFVGWGVGVAVAALAVAAAGRALGLRESRWVVELLPRTRSERAAFVGLAFSAGVGEELVFRGFLIPALGVATGSVALAAVMSAAVFGLLHAYQGAAGVVRAGVLGGLMAVPFLATGSVLPSMLGHFAYDVVAGLWLADWLLRR